MALFFLNLQGRSTRWKVEKLICPKTGKMFMNFWSSDFFLFVKRKTKFYLCEAATETYCAIWKTNDYEPIQEDIDLRS